MSGTYTSMEQSTCTSFIQNRKHFILQMASKEIKSNDSSVNNCVYYLSYVCKFWLFHEIPYKYSLGSKHSY